MIRLGVVLVLALSACAPFRGSVDRLDVLLSLLNDGSLEVQETWVVRFEGRTSTFVRALPWTYHDGLSNVRTSLDGHVLDDRPGPQRAVAAFGRRPEVIWTIAPIDDGVRTFQVRYVAARTLAVTGGRVRFTWPVLPGSHGWRIREARLLVTVPPGTAPAAPPGIAEAGWKITERPDGILAERADVAPVDSATVNMEFSRDAFSAAEPEWQHTMERAAEFVPAFASAALFIVTVGAAVLVMIRVVLPRGRVGAAEASLGLDADVAALDPEVRSVLRTGRAGWLARRGLYKYLTSVGFADHGRVAAADGLRVSGVVLVVLGPLLAVGVRLTLDSFGPWAMSIPVAVALVGVLFVVAGARLNILTPAGEGVRTQDRAALQNPKGPTYQG